MQTRKCLFRLYGEVFPVHFVATECRDSYNDDYFMEDTLRKFLGKILKAFEAHRKFPNK